MSNQQFISVSSVAQEESLGELWLGDQLYNALHGVGDISIQHKIAVCMVMHDHYCPDRKFISTEQEALPGYVDGRDEIIRIVLACLRSVPDVAEPILGRWCEQSMGHVDRRTCELLAARGIELAGGQAE